MILVRKDSLGLIEEFDLDEFEEKVRKGQIGPHMEICFPVVTGDRFVVARDLELYQGLYQTDVLNFKRYFHLGRIPWLTISLIALLCCVHYWWPEPPGRSADRLLQRGAKSLPLMLELGQWWRLLTANFIHVSGWHLLVNCLFLFNLGGPAEAIFRRLDYIFILVATALGGTLLSTLVNPAVSCGASGIVFGVWGASATFGVRYRNMLPKRYRRYFIGSVIPYSVFALYMGIAMPGIDNWGHLGGLLIGSGLACFLPARMLRPQDPWATSKILILAITALVIALGANFAAGTGDLVRNHYYPRNGLIVAVPQNWLTLVEEREINTENYAYHNEASVVIAFETREVNHPSNLEEFTREFLEVDFAQQLELHNTRGL
ncbi:MAG: rhomboid family intramembrane serine protease, partial [Deltaproteobacteria bacterium]|nr:rhomboid family intramembrane serine protease [Deltaproteobacteria bacterium]